MCDIKERCYWTCGKIEELSYEIAEHETKEPGGSLFIRVRSVPDMHVRIKANSFNVFIEHREDEKGYVSAAAKLVKPDVKIRVGDLGFCSQLLRSAFGGNLSVVVIVREMDDGKSKNGYLSLVSVSLVRDR